MKQKLTRKLPIVLLLLSVIFSFSPNIKGQKVEKVILYENFGGATSGTSDALIQPDAWPTIHADSGKYSGWYTTLQKVDNKNTDVPVPQFYSNSFFHTDSLIKYRTGGIGDLDITIDDITKTWTREVALRNGYKNIVTGLPTVGMRFLGAGVFPKLSSWISYAPFTPSFLVNQTDEKGYIYLGKDMPIGTKFYRPMVTIPSIDYEFLQDISKIEMLISGSRLGQNNTLSVKIEELTDEGITVGTKTLTYSATIEPRLISVPVNRNYCRIYIQSWGSANNANVTDVALLNGNTEVDTRTTYNWNAIAGIKPTDGTANAGQLGNPGMSIHMIKIYAMVDGGYSITTNNTLVTGTTSGISYDQSVTLTAQATNSGNKFMGWKIDGVDLAEVVNPLTVKVNKDMNIQPLYAGDQAEVAVVNENFTNWIRKGTVVPASNNMLKYDNASTTTITTNGGYDSDIPVPVKIPLRYGFKSPKNADSIALNLKYCYVIPEYGLRVFNIPGWEKQIGYIAIVAKANNNKGYVVADTLNNITKAEISLSSIDIPNPNRACVVKVNGQIVRNEMLQTLYAHNVSVSNATPANPFVLQIGPGNQTQCEYTSTVPLTANLETDISAAAVALHSVKMFAKVTLPSKDYFKLTIPAFTGGYITGITPTATNSTNHYMEGTIVTIGANPTLGFGFDGWVDENGTPVSQSNPLTITLDANKTIKPVFAQNPSYINLAANTNGAVTTSIKPQETNGNVMTFLAGVPVSLTATPKYGFKFTKWTKNGVDAATNPLALTGADLVKNATLNLTVVYDSITTRRTLKIINELAKGTVEFANAPENPTTTETLQTGSFPSGITVEATAKPGYGYDFKNWVKGFAIANTDTLKNPVSVAIQTTKDTTIATQWVELARKKLIIRSGNNGSIAVTDVHFSGTLEQTGLWPINYSVELTATPADGYILASIGDSASANFLSDNVITVNMDRDTVIVRPQFAKRQVGVFMAVNENFQDAIRWPQPEGTVSNVLGARDFLGLGESWDPKTYNNNLEGLLKVLAPYRVWGSQSNDNSEGPNGTKTPKTTLNLIYKNAKMSTKLKAGSGSDSVKLTVANYAPCNDCLIGKAVKESSVGNSYLGHVTAGMVALKKPNITNRSAVDFPPIVENDSIGMLMVEGMAYIEKVEIGYVSSGTQYCPGVFYTVEPIELINANSLFAASYSDLWSIGQLGDKERAYTPYSNNKYGWGSAQEGMKMDQNMYIAEEGALETKLLITAGYKKSGSTGAEVYSYTDIYIHDLKIWGIPIKNGNVGYKDLLDNPTKDGCRIYVLGNTNILKIETSEAIKAVALVNSNGTVVKVLRSNNTSNEFNVASLKSGIYGVQAIGRSGKLYKGSFGKVD